MQNKILFISHDASRTGAPILLLNLLKWLSKNTDIKFDILLIAGGELEKEFEKFGKVYYWQVPAFKPIVLKRQIYNRIFKIEHNPKKTYYENLFEELGSNKYDIIYGNTVLASRVIPQLINSLPSAKLILHIHELKKITSDYKRYLEFLRNLENVEYIAASKLTQENLVQEHHILKEKIHLIYEYIDLQKIENSELYKKENNFFVITGSGLVQTRKGYDIFMAIAKRGTQKYPDIPFLFKWIGKIPENLKYYLNTDIQNSGLSNQLQFIGELKNPYNEFYNSDVFLMTSREDPFPLVAVEHAAFGKPIVCFDKVTGIPELVEDNAGIIVPYFDIEAACDALAVLYNDKNKYQSYSISAKEKAQNYDIEIQVPKILNIIENA